ncbi:MAG: cytoplasmic protein [Desulfomonilaceae bacterium]
MKKYLQQPHKNIGRGVPVKKQFEGLRATELYCPNCKASMPVRERLLLVLPEGDKYEYLCARCGSSLGERIAKEPPKPLLIV